MSNGNWIEVCALEEIESEDVMRFDYGDRTFAIYCTEDNKYYATDGFCTHEKFHLSNGLVMGNTIECPKHNGRFDIPTGKAKRTPVCVDLVTYPTKIQNGFIFIQI
jgi:3-phenylpropionate/trans-cinnamate dioxygenase ferredoxin subunit